MGIFGFKEKYDVTPKEEELKTFVTNYNAVDVIKMNAKVVVPQGYAFIIGKKGKACDAFEAGEYFLTTANLPYMCRKFKIDKIKDGKQQDKIPADMYFVSKDLRGGIFKTYRKVNMGTKAYGFYAIKVMGMFTYKVKDVRELMQSLLNEFDYIKTGEAESIIEGWANEVIVNELESQNFILKDIIANSPIITDALKSKLGRIFETAGLELVDLKITKYTLPKEYQAESDKNIELQLQGDVQTVVEAQETAQKQQEEMANDDAEDDAEDYDMENIEGDIEEARSLLREFGIGDGEEAQTTSVAKEEPIDEIIQSVEQSLGQLEKSEDYAEQVANNQEEVINDLEQNFEQEEQNGYVPFGNFVIEDSGAKEKDLAKCSKPKKTFVDLSLNELYNDTTNTKRCLNCGAENDVNADHCALCGDKFNFGE